MHEQFHSEIKSDQGLEHLPSGKFDTNDAILHLAAFVYHCLHLLGQRWLTGVIAPIRHPAKRRRLKTVLQEIMYLTAKFIAHARWLTLNFGRGVAAHVKVLSALQDRPLVQDGFAVNHFLCMTKELNVTMHSEGHEGVGAPRRQEMT